MLNAAGDGPVRAVTERLTVGRHCRNLEPGHRRQAVALLDAPDHGGRNATDYRRIELRTLDVRVDREIEARQRMGAKLSLQASGVRLRHIEDDTRRAASGGKRHREVASLIMEERGMEGGGVLGR